MKKALFFICLIGIFSSFVQEKKPLKIVITKLKDTNSPILIGVYRKQDGFPSSEKAPFKGYNFKPEGKNVASISIEDLAHGEYAIAVYQDKNNDNKLNTGMFGIPKEPYAFSNNFKPKFSAPKYEDCKFVYSQEKNELTIALLD
jgi:uncharacterized protein (DUF2141 family)